MDKNTLYKEIKKIMSDISKIDIPELKNEIKVREEIGIDSLMVMEIITTCERKYQIKINEDRLNKIETIKDFLELIFNLVNKHA